MNVAEIFYMKQDIDKRCSEIFLPEIEMQRALIEQESLQKILIVMAFMMAPVAGNA